VHHVLSELCTTTRVHRRVLCGLQAALLARYALVFQLWAGNYSQHRNLHEVRRPPGSNRRKRSYHRHTTLHVCWGLRRGSLLSRLHRTRSSEARNGWSLRGLVPGGFRFDCGKQIAGLPRQTSSYVANHAFFSKGIDRWVVLSLALVGFALIPPEVMGRGPDICLWKHLFHLTACPACGSTRALAAFFHGHVGQALSYNRNVLLTGPLLIVLLVHSTMPCSRSGNGWRKPGRWGPVATETPGPCIR
jgi:hypothetical protein